MGLSFHAGFKDEEAKGNLTLEVICHCGYGRFCTLGCWARIYSIAPVERRCPATLIMSPVRDMTYR